MDFSNNINLRYHLSRILLEIELAETAYQDYFSNGQTLFYAKLLRKTNCDLIATLKESTSCITYEGIKVTAELIYHLEAWTLAWDDHLNSLPELKQSNLQTEFIFQSPNRFPKRAVRFFKNLFDKTLEEKDNA